MIKLEIAYIILANGFGGFGGFLLLPLPLRVLSLPYNGYSYTNKTTNQNQVVVPNLHSVWALLEETDSILGCYDIWRLKKDMNPLFKVLLLAFIHHRFLCMLAQT